MGKKNKIHGLDIVTKYGLMTDQRWDVNKYEFNEVIKEMSNKDKELLSALDYIGDGELSGTAMFVQMIQYIENEIKDKKKKKDLEDLSEIIMYGMMVITYDEFRHGLVLKELRAARDGESFINTVKPSESFKYINGIEIWDDPYEILVSLFLGEIVNEALYNSLAKSVDSEKFKEIIKNIEKDERRHKMAWFELTEKLLKKKKHRKRYVKALKKTHFYHQAETGYTFFDGIKDTRELLNHGLMDKVHETRYKMLKKLLGEDMPLTLEEMKSEYAKHMKDLIIKKMKQDKGN